MDIMEMIVTDNSDWSDTDPDSISDSDMDTDEVISTNIHEIQKLAMIIEEYPVFLKTCSKCNNDIVNIRDKIIYFLTDSDIDNVFFVQSLNLHICMYLTQNTDIDVILLSMSKFLNYELNSLQLYIQCIVNAITKLSNLPKAHYNVIDRLAPYPYMDKLIMISESLVTKENYEKLSEDIIMVCNLKQHKILYVKLFVRCIESLLEWKLGIRGHLAQRGIKDYNGNIIEYLNHDWLKVCSHAIYVSQIQNEKFPYKYQTIKQSKPPGLGLID